MRIWNLCCEFNENLAVCLRKNALYRGKGRFFLKCAVASLEIQTLLIRRFVYTVSFFCTYPVCPGRSC